MRMPLLMISRCRHVSIETDMRKYLPQMTFPAKTGPFVHGRGDPCGRPLKIALHSKISFHAGVIVDYGAFHLLNQVGNGDAARAGVRAVKDGSAAPHTVTLSQ